LHAALSEALDYGAYRVVKPLGVDRTKVSFLSYVWDPSRLDRGAGSGLDRVKRVAGVATWPGR
jgi:hypothetical protein